MWWAWIALLFHCSHLEKGGEGERFSWLFVFAIRGLPCLKIYVNNVTIWRFFINTVVGATMGIKALNHERSSNTVTLLLADNNVVKSRFYHFVINSKTRRDKRFFVMSKTSNCQSYSSSAKLLMRMIKISRCGF